jgi:NTE family protein
MGKEARIGLVLGGGGARGLAHIGVLKVIEEVPIPIDILVGSSIGALVGGAYASGSSPQRIEEKVAQYLEGEVFQSSALKAIEQTRSFNGLGFGKRIQGYLKNRYLLIQAMLKPGILSGEDFQTTIDFFVPDILIEDTLMPFRAVATDLVSGEQITLSKGSLRQAVRASCAVPGAVEPLQNGDMILSDGGIISLIPISVARREGADIVIAVSVSLDICTEREFRNAVSVYTRATDIMSHQLKDIELSEADIVIQPDVGNLHWSEFSQAYHLIRIGEEAARARLTEIHQTIPGRKKWFTLTQVLKQIGKKSLKKSTG